MSDFLIIIKYLPYLSPARPMSYSMISLTNVLFPSCHSRKTSRFLGVKSLRYICFTWRLAPRMVWIVGPVPMSRRRSPHSISANYTSLPGNANKKKITSEIVYHYFSMLRINWNCNFVGLLHHPFWLQLVFSHFWIIFLQLFKPLCLAKDHWYGFSTRNAHMVHIVNLIGFKMVYTS